MLVITVKYTTSTKYIVGIGCTDTDGKQKEYVAHFGASGAVNDISVLIDAL